jgi:hypothetical protein
MQGVATRYTTCAGAGGRQPYQPLNPMFAGGGQLHGPANLQAASSRGGWRRRHAVMFPGCRASDRLSSLAPRCGALTRRIQNLGWLQLKAVYEKGVLSPGGLAGGRTGASLQYQMQNVRGDYMGCVQPAQATVVPQGQFHSALPLLPRPHEAQLSNEPPAWLSRRASIASALRSTSRCAAVSLWRRLTSSPRPRLAGGSLGRRASWAGSGCPS